MACQTPWPGSKGSTPETGHTEALSMGSGNPAPPVLSRPEGHAHPGAREVWSQGVSSTVLLCSLNQSARLTATCQRQISYKEKRFISAHRSIGSCPRTRAGVPLLRQQGWQECALEQEAHLVARSERSRRQGQCSAALQGHTPRPQLLSQHCGQGRGHKVGRPGKARAESLLLAECALESVGHRAGHSL